MRRTPWFERRFAPIDDNGLLPGIVERLAGTGARLSALCASRPLAKGRESGWSAAQEIGHLADLEPLWLQRVHDIRAGLTDLTPADLTNRKTHESDHDRRSAGELIQRFAAARAELVTALQALSDTDLARAARHPRLGTPMRIVDLACFVAEHDDHHLVRIRELLSTP